MISDAPREARKPPAQINLIPWDPDSPAHIERMIEQRIACGWRSEEVDLWRQPQREGKVNIQWVVLANNHPNKESELKKHISTYSSEKTELNDTATSLGGKARDSCPELKFLPVGHISLDTEYPHSDYEPNTPGIYYIAKFYISRAIQSSGLGRAAMDKVELTATSEPLNAKILALSTVLATQEGRKEKLAALGRNLPDVEPETWYSRRGYVVYKTIEKCWSELDSTGKEWFWTAVYMRKDIT